MKADIGVYGLSVMGGNLARNIAGRGFQTAVYTRSAERLRMFSDAYAGKDSNLIPCADPAKFCKALSVPRKILIMVKAGEAVDTVIGNLLPHLSRGDILIDGGNSLYTDTARRADELENSGIHFVGMGVSGGEEGALNGPSLMPGTSPEVWKQLKNILLAIAAKAPDGTPCCKPLGFPAAGHFVKMVHNGIEYADMQLIAEAWMILKNIPEVSDVPSIFRKWNSGVLESYLIEITARILEKKDPETGRPLVDLILDKAGQKGTGLWTSFAALELGVPATGITESVFVRMLSGLKEQRLRGSEILGAGELGTLSGITADDVEKALYASKICAYSQGFSMFSAANDQLEWELKPGEIASLWRGGCIIRAAFLNEIMDSFAENPNEENLIFQPVFSEKLCSCIGSWRKVVSAAIGAGIPIPVLSSQLSYYDSMRTAVLPANLIQAQRDCFGAHTYERIDKPGEFFHTDWLD
ncbi:MAG: NADP-dependent phosphogluconate dehydrogenase [Lentisphaeria bacterium]|nr:NADP-dependent phosphogluconate dehydrogenase [Lentisphaeria bacterium]